MPVSPKTSAKNVDSSDHPTTAGTAEVKIEGGVQMQSATVLTEATATENVQSKKVRPSADDSAAMMTTASRKPRLEELTAAAKGTRAK